MNTHVWINATMMSNHKQSARKHQIVIMNSLPWLTGVVNVNGKEKV